MQIVESWLAEAAPHTAYVALIAENNLIPFYNEFGFKVLKSKVMRKAL